MSSVATELGVVVVEPGLDEVVLGKLAEISVISEHEEADILGAGFNGGILSKGPCEMEQFCSVG